MIKTHETQGSGTEFQELLINSVKHEIAQFIIVTEHTGFSVFLSLITLIPD